jgi:hypothetical protein
MATGLLLYLQQHGHQLRNQEQRMDSDSMSQPNFTTSEEYLKVYDKRADLFFDNHHNVADISEHTVSDILRWIESNTQQARDLLMRRPGVVTEDDERPLSWDTWEMLRKSAWKGTK